MIPVTSHILYDPQMEREYHTRCRSSQPLICLQPNGLDWAIIPTHRGKTFHDVFFYSQDGLPVEVAQVFLKTDIVNDRGYALAYKGVIGLHAQNGHYYQTHKPTSIDFRGDEIWGDYYYAGIYCSILYALERGCERLAFFPTYGSLRTWQWEALVRASHNAMKAMLPAKKLTVCVICVSLPASFPRNEAFESINPHEELPYARVASYNGQIDLISFLPRDMKINEGLSGEAENTPKR